VIAPHAATRVLDREPHVTAGSEPRVGGARGVEIDRGAADEQPARLPGHRRCGVRGEVHHHLVDLRRIRQHRRQVGIDSGVDLDGRRNRRAHQLERVVDRRPQGHRRARVLLAAAERQDLRHQILRARARLRDLPQPVLEPGLTANLSPQ
jgi:hypothetical protein